MKWFTADLHLGHKNILKLCNRPFKTIEEMDKTIEDNFVNRIKKGDMLYILGDLSWHPELAQKFLTTVKGEKHFIIGNHDNKEIITVAEKYCVSVSGLEYVREQKERMILCHYPMRRWRRSYNNTWQLHGHCHGRLPEIGKQYDVGVDCNGFAPVSFDEIVKIMNTKSDNPDYKRVEKGIVNTTGMEAKK